MKAFNMQNFRLYLGISSGIIFIILLLMLAVTGSYKDIIGLLILVFFGVNTFYIIFSIPNFKASDALDGAATKLAIITLEIKYRAGEAKIKEDIQAQLQQEYMQEKTDRKLAAKDFLDFARTHPLLSRRYDLATSRSVQINPPDNHSTAAKNIEVKLTTDKIHDL